ncbi:hypothetical protein G6F57_011519 [Rhizopus arrhizus]|nr:hypothetical protein G6F20_011440 [Rhizopus arrhizus]KAG1409644.1 hypothetical protein G6F58_009326 [Rhizopus delemar]KAG0863791.1 hypothetical protein G6F16_011525 [Rhizopus arrhizus]KAG0906051.1 hypothetical protein G6F33_011682 [Rhizopus arrhizus]KAG0930769.1 hypothetical protein G6F30_011489 [Rhizopus arrhizus]
MEYILDQDEFVVVETIATHTDYLKKCPASSESSLACSMRIEKPKDKDIRMKEANVKRDYVRHTVQDKVDRKCILSKDHKTAIINFIDANPSAAAVEVTEHLLKRFSDLKVSRSTVYSFMKSECNLLLKKADFHSVERNSSAKIEEPVT